MLTCRDSTLQRHPSLGEEDEHEDHGGPPAGRGETSIVTRPRTQAREPSLYQVLLHNDDYTPMDFVVNVLELVFRFDHTRAQNIMLDVHQKGVGRCGIYPYDVAETKVALVTDMAREHEYPLKCTMEKA